MTGLLNGFVTVFTETEKEMVSVERAMEYIEEVESENYSETKVNLPYMWPAQGVVEFQNVFLRYRCVQIFMK